MTCPRPPLALLAAIVVAASTLAASHGHAAVIDNFTDTTFGGALLSAPGAIMHNDIGVAGVAGGNRSISLSATMATSLVNSVGFEISAGQASYASGPAANGAVSLAYGGAGLAAALGGTPQSIMVNFASFDDGFNLGMDVTVTVSDGVNSADLTKNISGSSPGAFSLDFSLADFNNVGLVDLANLTLIDANFEAGQGQDFVLLGINALVPEPASLVVWGTMLLVAGAFWHGRRKRWPR